MVVPPKEPQPDARSRRERGVRGRSLDVALRCFADSVGADYTALVTNEDGPTRAIASFARDGREPDASWMDGGIVDRALANSHAVDPFPDEAGGVRAVAVPVPSPNAVVGAIHARFERPAPQDAEQIVWAADAYARLVALCMSRDGITMSALLGSAGFDVLAGCLSYAGIVEAVEAEVSRSARRGYRCSCCVVEIDDFEQFDEGWGHLEGNRAIAAMAEVVGSATRRYDAVGRAGQASFLILLPETGARRARRVADRLRAGVRSALGTATTTPLDASIGVAEWDGESTATELIESARRAVRYAQVRGGGRVEVQRSNEDDLDGLTELTRELARPWQASGRDQPDEDEPDEDEPDEYEIRRD
jgi:diguanylate cyclase (GGDEF)-like protein